MRWFEGKIEVASENTDIAAAALLDFGIEGVEIIDAYENAKFIEGHPSNWDYVEDGLLDAEKGSAAVRFFVPEGFCPDMLANIRAGLAAYGDLTITTVEDDWTYAWKEHYKPFRIGRRVVIVPVWEDYAPAGDDIVFRIDPGHVFGTGQHQSTALCIEMLEEYVKPGAIMLDIGCGSGILGIIGLLLGAEHVNAVDIDPSAVGVCLENAGHNNIGRDIYEVCAGNILADDALRQRLGQGKYDIVAANIIADVIMQITPAVKEFLADGGVFVSSGIIDSRQDEVVAALKREGFNIAKITDKDNWVAIAATM